MNLFFLSAIVTLSIFISISLILLIFHKRFDKIYQSNILVSREHFIQNEKLDYIKNDTNEKEYEIFISKYLSSDMLIGSNIDAEEKRFVNSNIDYNKIVKRYVHILKQIHLFIELKKISLNVNINTKNLKTAIFDSSFELEKIKVNISKLYAYTAYWILRRKPIQIVKEFDGNEYINELFVTSYIASGILAINKSDRSDIDNNYMQFLKMLFYNLKYRNYNQQSLELMIEACFI